MIILKLIYKLLLFVLAIIFGVMYIAYNVGKNL